MIYFTFAQVLNAFVSFLLLGIIFGILYRFLLIFKDYISFVKSSFTMILIPYKNLVAKLKNGINNADLTDKKSNSNVLDFCFFLFLGLFFILTTYITYDGIFRLFMPIACISGFIPSFCFSKRIQEFLRTVLIKATIGIVIFLNILFSPVRFMVKYIIFLLQSIGKSIKILFVRCYKRVKSKKQQKNDIKI